MFLFPIPYSNARITQIKPSSTQIIRYRLVHNMQVDYVIPKRDSYKVINSMKTQPLTVLSSWPDRFADAATEMLLALLVLCWHCRFLQELLISEVVAVLALLLLLSWVLLLLPLLLLLVLLALQASTVAHSGCMLSGGRSADTTCGISLRQEPPQSLAEPPMAAIPCRHPGDQATRTAATHTQKLTCSPAVFCVRRDCTLCGYSWIRWMSTDG